MDKSAYMGAPCSGSGGGGGGYSREEYAWGQPSAGSGGFGSGGGSSNPPGVTKPRTDQSCYMGP
ncbi:hypothetical protein PMAYCL1PPCAC_04310 [Pristionchus mayeri]|uniref:Uncharacterized protein n=1 Tax=Pristionchus mayeri TaxID=1317129 RepID=A0AAN5C7Y7_9BILA|nr:hypothetical protein PMAYCL1PPCAC_04310 [Pristionchus mayeri]